ncbi:uncharacterized protein CANTADRAFT_56403 [Suhomyces tanzawaensis NRRL Y-17324]|uniref:Major facilitator superfamily (MFS) profile domain-containing protein n=1 Tax=Suhomyces tanzawaensis NRRL Y-17324 TaxID=984487 RepID=A0A1E4SDU2_9ASCO|nr:uncharacterized protein CANTADRAFT_56403 [Suhomyces tanzawaensis NRRL Y-17324]ODV77562.1 hypothetical protein CANTADRAFT_56403 [Suhomyces tanzawaensis NRRL Y-17324]
MSVFSEIGLHTLLQTSKDVYIIILLRMIRLIGFGGTSLIIVLYLKEIGFREEFIGLFMTLTFLGDLVSSFLLAVTADQIGRKRVLLFSAVCMTLTGLVYGLVEDHYVLTAVAVLGILTPSGGEVGAFRSIEQSSLASLTLPQDRSDIYAWYTFLGQFCSAIGSVACGSLISYTNTTLGYSIVESYKIAFLGYTILSFISFILIMCISNKIEPNVPIAHSSSLKRGTNSEAAAGTLEATPETETTQLLPASAEVSEPVSTLEQKGFISQFLPTLHPSTYVLVVKLSLLFGLDSFASSLVPNSWQSYYIREKFHVSPATLGSIFFTTTIIAGVASLLSTSLTKRLGAVVTMVGTHLPSSIALAFIPISPSLKITLSILVIRACTQSMDVAPKHVFLAALVPDSERTAVFGWVNVVKTLGQAIGPVFVGFLTGGGMQWLTFIVASALKSTYDVGILVTFLSYNRHAQH